MPGFFTTRKFQAGTLTTTLGALVIVVVALVMHVTPAHAQDAMPADADATLDIASVLSPNINCRFATTCIWQVEKDFVDEIPLAGTNGEGWLQSRTFAAGDVGTAGEGLYPYLYKFNFAKLAVTSSPVECIAGFTLPFGKIAPVDYDEDGEMDDLFVESGNGATPALQSATLDSAGNLTMTFAAPFCPDALGTEYGSYFIGIASTQPKMTLPAQVDIAGGAGYTVNALVPATALVQLPMIVNQ